MIYLDSTNILAYIEEMVMRISRAETDRRIPIQIDSSSWRLLCVFLYALFSF